MAKQNIVSKLALVGCFFALGVIALGAFTRLMNAGLGCPDWPGCYGHMIVSDQHHSLKAWTEMIHRYFVGGLSFFLLSVIITVFVKKIFRIRINIILSICLLMLLIYQIFLGKLTVTYKLLPIIVTQHLLGGYFILSILWLIYLSNCNIKQNGKNNFLNIKKRSVFMLGGLIAFFFLIIQIILGAWTSTHYASFSCPDFPFCLNDQPEMTLYFKEAFNIFAPIGMNYEGGVLPEAVRQTIQMLHRIGALVVTMYLFIFFGYVLIKLKNMSNLIKTIYIIFGILLIQICLGIANVILKLPLPVAMSHTVCAVLLLLAIITFLFNLIAFSEKKRCAS